MQFSDDAPVPALREPLGHPRRQGAAEAELQPEGEGVADAGARQHHETPAALGVIPLEEVRHLATAEYPLLSAKPELDFRPSIVLNNFEYYVPKIINGYKAYTEPFIII